MIDTNPAIQLQLLLNKDFLSTGNLELNQDKSVNIVDEARIEKFSLLCRQKIAAANSTTAEKAFALSALNHIEAMRKRGETVLSIRRYVESSFPLLGEAIESLNHSSKTLQQGRVSFNQACNEVGSMMSSFNFSQLEPPLLPHYVGSKRPKKNENEFDPISQKMALGMIKDHMADMRTVGEALEKRSNVFNTVAKAIFCGGPDGEERCKKDLNTLVEFGKTTLEYTGLKEPVKKLINKVSSDDGSKMEEMLRAFGAPQKEAESLSKQYASDVKGIVLSCIPLGKIGSVVKTGASKVIGAVASAKLKSVVPQAETKLLSKSVVRIPVSQDHYLNRQITKRTKMVPEDVGISSIDYFRDRKPFTYAKYLVRGWMTPKKDVFKIKLDMISVPSGSLGNWLTVMSNFKKIAKANQASTLHFEAQIVNEKLLSVMTRRYGKPLTVWKHSAEESVEHQIFKIPIEASLPKSLSSPLRLCGKEECAGKYIRDMKEFITLPAFINRKLKRDLVLVQYHGPGPVGVGRSHNWWMLASKTNKLHTVSEVMDKAGLLSNWGKRTHVSVARIPKGEEITTLLGKAREQIDSITGEVRPGGAIQMRIKGFKPEWVVETRKIPGAD